MIVPNSNGEDNRPAAMLREFNTHHDARGRFSVAGSASVHTDTAHSQPRQPVAATSLKPSVRGALMQIIAPDAKGYDVNHVMSLAGPKVETAARSLVYDKAPVADQEFRAKIANVQHALNAKQAEGVVAIQQALTEPGAMVAVGPIKSMHRVLEKAIGGYSGDVGQIRDMVRATVAVPNLADVPRVLKALKAAGLKPIGGVMENRFDTPTDLGYRDIKYNVRMPGTNVIGEIQVHTKAMLAAKEGLGHTYYEEARTLKALRRSQRRPYTPVEKARLAELTHLSKALYAKAYADSGGR